ncbi:glycosyltransferase family 2 protein [Patescibacteria group bacterium]
MINEATSQYGAHRFWEILPGVLVWGTFVLAIALSFFLPFWVIVFIIVFDLLWLFRIIYYVVHLFFAWREYRVAIKTDWSAKLVGIERASRIHHLIFLPTCQEGIEILRETFQALQACRFDQKRMILVLAGEERDAENFRYNAQLIKNEFGSVFKQIIITEHPIGLPDEIPGKGSNQNYSAKQTVKVLNEEYPEIEDKNIIVSSFDVDTIPHLDYFSYLTYLYCTVKDPERSSYQPVTLYSNNIWTAPAPVRVAAFGTTFWLMGELARPERLWTFSSHSMPWVMLKDVGFWQKNIVSEDSRIFLQAFVRYNGDYRVTPMYLPVSMDTVTGSTYWESLVALYKQQRRWAWGVEHLPVMMQAFRENKLIPLKKKAKYLFNHIEGMYTWATAPILIFILGWLPLTLTQESEALVQAAPFTLQHLMRFATLGVFVSGILALTLLPRRPKQVRPHTWLIMIAQWALLPITFIVLGAFPAIDAQTRLMLGKYLGFNVTKKAR